MNKQQNIYGQVNEFWKRSEDTGLINQHLSLIELLNPENTHQALDSVLIPGCMAGSLGIAIQNGEDNATLGRVFLIKSPRKIDLFRSLYTSEILIGFETVEDLLVKATNLIDNLEINFDDYVLPFDSLDWMKPMSMYSRTSGIVLPWPNNFIDFLLTSIIKTSTDLHKTKKISCRRALAYAVVKAAFKSADKVPVTEVFLILKKLGKIVGNKLLQQVILEEYPLHIKSRATHATIGAWIEFLLTDYVGIAPIDLTPQILDVAKREMRHIMLYRFKNTNIMFTTWFKKVIPKRIVILHNILGNVDDGINPHSLAAVIFAQEQNYSLLYAMRISAIAYVKNGKNVVFWRELIDYLLAFIPIKNSDKEFKDMNLQLRLFQDIVRTTNLSSIDCFSGIIDNSSPYFVHMFLTATLSLNSEVFAEYLQQRGISVANVHDKTVASYPFTKNIGVDGSEALVRIVINAHKKECGELDVKALLYTIKKASSNLWLYMPMLLKNIDEDAFLLYVTTSRVIYAYLEANQIQALDVMSRISSQPLKEKLMKNMFE